MKDQQKLRVFLLQRESYPEPTCSVELKETHISLVYLTDGHAYKFKKTIKQDFLDYSTLHKRQEACLAELELGRRFAGNVYEQVVAVRERADGTLSFGEQGKIVEYAVKMLRLPEQLMLSQRLKEGGPSPAELDRLILHVQQCYQTAAKVHLLPSEYSQRVRHHVADNRQTILQLAERLGIVPDPWRSICCRQSLFVELHRMMFEERVRMQWIIDGHGDLRPEHVFLGEAVAFIDGVEFSQDFRCLDVSDELCFLAMEAAAMGHAEFARSFLQKSLQALHVNAPPELLAFYQSYRAIVRAKVALIRAEQLPVTERQVAIAGAEHYRHLAQESLQTFAAPKVFIVAGPMGSGKTSLAKALQARLGAEHIQTDRVRQELFGRNEVQDGFNQGRYTPESRQKVYQLLKLRMEESLEKGMVVILDGTFGEPDLLQVLVQPLLRRGIAYFILSCVCPEPVALQRIQARFAEGQSESDARPELYHQQKSRSDWNFVGQPYCLIDTTLSLEQQLLQLFAAL